MINGHFFLSVCKDKSHIFGQYSNTLANEIFEEKGIRKTQCIEPSDLFIGEFDTKWIEKHKKIDAVLKIKYKDKSKCKIYLLEWKRDDITIFIGEGFLAQDSFLIGSYMSN